MSEETAEERANATPAQSAAFWAKVDKTGACWLWTAAQNNLGYGYVTINKVQVGAHRMAYFLARGSIPEGMQLDHLCRVRNCVNPDHLDPVPGRINLLRGENPWAVNKRKTHCIRGHEFTPDNTGRSSLGNRQCLACNRAASARRKRERRRERKTA